MAVKISSGVPGGSNDKGYVNHGATAGTARPEGFASIEWAGSVEPTNALNDDTWVGAPDTVLDALLAVYKPFRRQPANLLAGGLSSGNDHLAGAAAQTVVTVAGTNTGLAAFHIDPADLAITGKSTKMRLKGMFRTNTATDPGSGTFTLHLYPVATWGGGSSAHPTIATVGTSVASVLVANDPAVSTTYDEVSSDFDIPAAGYYCLAWRLTTTLVAGGHSMGIAELDYRHV